MRQLPIALLLIVYVLVVGQGWAYYAAALMIYAYDRYDGRWDSVPFKLGRGRMTYLLQDAPSRYRRGKRRSS